MSSNSVLGLCLIDIQQDFDCQHCGVWSQVSAFGRKIVCIDRACPPSDKMPFVLTSSTPQVWSIIVKSKVT